MPADAPTQSRDPRGFLIPLLLTGLLLACVGAIASIGLPTKSAGLLVVVERSIGAGIPAALWLLGALGLGRFFAPLIPKASFGLSLQFASGLALALFLAHLLGFAGLYSLHVAQTGAWIPTALGLVMLIKQVRANRAGLEAQLRAPLALLLLIPALAVLWAASAHAPGAIWTSEAHAYDSLSYHLQLPREWLSIGRIATLDHNAYSGLPSYMEAAYTQLAAMMGGTTNPASGAGLPLYAAHMLHALIACAAALLVARAARVTTLPTIAAGALLLATPWVTVTASLAYNEMPVLALFAGAIIALRTESIHPTARGLLVGTMLGVACGCKPTALFMAAIPCALIAAIVVPRKSWLPIAVATFIAGFVALLPWFVRNIIDTGNPLFPFATDLFGLGHWSPDQAARWNAEHTFDGSLSRRLESLVSPDRGLLHAQWSIVPGLILLAIPIALISKPHRRLAIALSVALLAQLIAWLFVGHLQSRFLIPILVPGCALFALASDALFTNRPTFVRGCATLATCIAVLIPTTTSIINYLAQRDAKPNTLLLAGAEAFNGSDIRDNLLRMSPSERETVYNNRAPEVFANIELAAEPSNKLLLIGSATPLYYDLPLAYATTWDTPPLIAALDRAAWNMPVAVELLRSDGITHVLIDFLEMMRLRESARLDPRMGEELANSLTDYARIVRLWQGPNRYTLLLDIRDQQLLQELSESP